MLSLRTLAISLILLPVLVGAAEAVPPATFKAGVDYVKLANNIPDSSDNQQVSVVEFFSYGCSWCARLEPSLEKWLKANAAKIEFSRAPVVFNPTWQVYARAYYVAYGLGVEDKLTPAIFNVIHLKKENLTTEEKMQAFFEQNGVSKEDFNSAYSTSPTVDAETAQAQSLARDYEITGVPAFVVGGKYKTDPGMVNGDLSKLLQVVDFLIAKERAHLTKNKS